MFTVLSFPKISIILRIFFLSNFIFLCYFSLVDNLGYKVGSVWKEKKFKKEITYTNFHNSFQNYTKTLSTGNQAHPLQGPWGMLCMVPGVTASQMGTHLVNMARLPWAAQREPLIAVPQVGVNMYPWQAGTSRPSPWELWLFTISGTDFTCMIKMEALEMERLSWSIWEDSQCNHKHPLKRKANKSDTGREGSTVTGQPILERWGHMPQNVSSYRQP